MKFADFPRFSPGFSLTKISLIIKFSSFISDSGFNSHFSSFLGQATQKCCVLIREGHWKTSLRSPSIASLVDANSPGWFDYKVGCARKSKDLIDLAWKSKNLRFAVELNFAVKSTRGAFCHSRGQTRWSQARLSFFKNLCIKKHSKLSDRPRVFIKFLLALLTLTACFYKWIILL